MARLHKLAAKDLDASSFQLILIYINEAHTKGWPIGGLPIYDKDDEKALRSSGPQPDPQGSLADRKACMDALAAKLPPSLLASATITWAIDSWAPLDDFESPTFENLFRAWPDRFYRLEGLTIKERSVYGNAKEENAALINDYADLL